LNPAEANRGPQTGPPGWGGNPYLKFVSEQARAVADGRSLPLGGLPPAPRPMLAPDAPRALVFAPHPDDECITGGLALRLLREAGMRVIDVAVTQGSRKDRQAARLAELRAACDFIGFQLATTAPGGLERINPRTRAEEAAHWQSSVEVIAGILRQQAPRVVFLPHAADWNSTHIGTHLLVVDALARLGPHFPGLLVETEFWAPMPAPNLMVESSVADVADLVAATSFHAGEVERNPYHLRLPAWLQDNVRRGGEVVGGQGGTAPDFTFATLYGARRFRDGRLEPAWPGGRHLAAGDDPLSLLDSF
jgi:N-acetylglucosamine malate deacetylase 1